MGSVPVRVMGVAVVGALAAVVWAFAVGAWLVMVIVTMAGADRVSPSNAVKVNVSVPWAPAPDVYEQLPVSPAHDRVPLAGSVSTRKVVASASGSAADTTTAVATPRGAYRRLCSLAVGAALTSVIDTVLAAEDRSPSEAANVNESDPVSPTSEVYVQVEPSPVHDTPPRADRRSRS